MSNIIIHPTRLTTVAFQQTLRRAGDDERWDDQALSIHPLRRVCSKYSITIMFLQSLIAGAIGFYYEN